MKKRMEHFRSRTASRVCRRMRRNGRVELLIAHKMSCLDFRDQLPVLSNDIKRTHKPPSGGTQHVRPGSGQRGASGDTAVQGESGIKCPAGTAITAASGSALQSLLSESRPRHPTPSMVTAVVTPSQQPSQKTAGSPLWAELRCSAYRILQIHPGRGPGAYGNGPGGLSGPPGR